MKHIPKNKSGNIYYVRLSTHQGIFYKIGFTTQPSVRRRFSYGKSEKHKLIDKVILFTRDKNAFSIEQRLHRYFRRAKAFPSGRIENAPLYRNGQSELYRADILGLDTGPGAVNSTFKPKGEMARLVNNLKYGRPISTWTFSRKIKSAIRWIIALGIVIPILGQFLIERI